MKGALPETGRAKSKGADAKPEAGRDAHFTGTKIILFFSSSFSVSFFLRIQSETRFCFHSLTS